MIYGIDYATRTMSGLAMGVSEEEPLRCGACGKTAVSLSRCVWDESLMVGACCEIYSDHQCPVCNSDNLEFADAAVKCLDCGCITTKAACEVQIGPFELTSPAEMPRLEAVRIRPVGVPAPGFHKSGAA